MGPGRNPNIASVHSKAEMGKLVFNCNYIDYCKTELANVVQICTDNLNIKSDIIVI